MIKEVQIILALSHNFLSQLQPRQRRELLLVEAGERMLQQDLKAIASLGMIDRKHGKVRAAKEVVIAFLAEWEK